MYLVNCRNYEEFEKVVHIAQKLVEKLNTSAELAQDPVHFRRRRR
jgi:hypothetical protein